MYGSKLIRKIGETATIGEVMLDIFEFSSVEDQVALPKPKKRDLFFTKQVDQDSISELTESIIEIEKHDQYLKAIYKLHNLDYNPAPIKIYIDSYGGIVYQCFGLISVMRECKTPICTIVTGTAMSCGFIIAISGHKRLCYADSTYMYHQVSTGAIGTLRDLESEFIEAARLQHKIEEITLRHTKFTEQRLEEIYNMREDFFMGAEEALDYGCVDEVIGAINTSQKVKAARTVSKKPVNNKK